MSEQKKYGEYGLPYIKNKDLFSAVMVACNEISSGTDIVTSICIGAERRGVKPSKVWALVQESDCYCDLIAAIEKGFDNLDYNLSQIDSSASCIYHGNVPYGDDDGIGYQISYAREHLSQAKQLLDLIKGSDEDDE